MAPGRPIELPSHPLLDLSPTERSVLLKAERGEMGRVLTVGEARAIHRLWNLGLIEVQDGWFPTPNRGSAVALIFIRLENLAEPPGHPKKQAAMEEQITAELERLIAEVCAMRA